MMSLPSLIAMLLGLRGMSTADQEQEIADFQKLFMTKRIEQLTAVKNIQKLEDAKRKVLLDQISTKLFQVT